MIGKTVELVTLLKYHTKAILIFKVKVFRIEPPNLRIKAPPNIGPSKRVFESLGAYFRKVTVFNYKKNERY